GSYHIKEGDPLQLVGQATPATGSHILSVSWDLKGDGKFADATGLNPTAFSWSDLTALGLGYAGTYTIGMRVVSDTNTITVYGKLTIDYVHPKIQLTDPGVGTVGVPYTIGFTAPEVGSETLTSWTVNWGDGTTDTLPSDAATATHTYREPFDGNLEVRVYD